MKSIAKLLVGCLLCLPLMIFAADLTAPYINNYDSFIVINPDSSLTVSETITITTDGSEVRHGIYRDFPTIYRSKTGGVVHVGFDVLKAILDGKAVKYAVKKRSNGVRVYLGSKSTRLPAGVYTFQLVYKTTGQLGFFKNHDELYWNVTGNGWDFPIEQVTATINFPPAVVGKVSKYTAYTGSQGSRAQNYQASLNAEQQLVFKTTQPLAAHQGMTIAAAWPVGLIKKPSFIESNSRDITIYTLLVLGIIVVLVYYLATWSKVGRDPKLGAIMPEYYPPEGFTPAALRYIMDMGFDNRVLASAVLNLAVKGALKIEETKKKHYTLHKVDDFSGELSAAEKILMKRLFGANQSISLDKAGCIKDVVTAYRDALKTEFATTYFETNNRYSMIGAVLSVIAVGIGILLNMQLMPVAIFMAFFIIITMGTKGRIRSRFADAFKRGFFQTIIVVAVFVIFLAGHASEINELGIMFPWVYIGLCALLIIINLIFVNLLRRPTIAGAHVIKHVKGFKMFLDATERQRMAFRNPPDKTPELFEKYLPYALALGVEQRWSENFADVLQKANYQPNWYVGNNMMWLAAAGFSSGFVSSFNQSISSASAAPGSSSGFGGGGFSGGGGGGGGGGGW